MFNDIRFNGWGKDDETRKNKTEQTHKPTHQFYGHVWNTGKGNGNGKLIPFCIHYHFWITY